MVVAAVVVVAAAAQSLIRFFVLSWLHTLFTTTVLVFGPFLPPVAFPEVFVAVAVSPDAAGEGCWRPDRRSFVLNSSADVTIETVTALDFDGAAPTGFILQFNGN